MSVILDYSFGKVGLEWKTRNCRDSVEMDKIILTGGDIKEMARKYSSAQVLCTCWNHTDLDNYQL